jgi:hypothetical protein
MGARRFYYRLLHPSFNVAAIQREYDITEYILGLTGLTQRVDRQSHGENLATRSKVLPALP